MRENAMRITTTIGFKGGIGRSSVVMALVMALLEMGRRVRVVDASHAIPIFESMPDGTPISGEGRGYEAPAESPLEAWGRPLQRMLQFEDREGQLRATSATNSADARSAADEVREEGYDVCLFDTPPYEVPAVRAIVALSHLVLVPARNSSEADAHSLDLPAWIFRSEERLVRGVVCGSRDPAGTRAAFARMPTLHAVLPLSSRGYGRLRFPVIGGPPDPAPPPAEFTEALDALAQEVDEDARRVEEARG